MFDRFLEKAHRFLFNEPRPISREELEAIIAKNPIKIDKPPININLLSLAPISISNLINFQDLSSILTGDHEEIHSRESSSIPSALQHINTKFDEYTEWKANKKWKADKEWEADIYNFLLKRMRLQQERQGQGFYSNEQNTHRSEVNTSINASVSRLKARYSDIDIDKTLEEIKGYLNNLMPDTDHQFVIQFAIACIDRIQQDSTIHSLSNLKLSDVLALIWKGIHDESALAEDVKYISPEDIEDKRRLLLKQLYQAQTEYGTDENDNACFMGTYNKIIETLNRIHPDVLIITGKENILPVAIARTSAIIVEEFRKRSKETQRLILKHWSDSDSEGSKTIATQFREAMVKRVNKCLKKEFEKLLTKAQRKEITSQFEYLPSPKLGAEQDPNFKAALSFYRAPQPKAISKEDELNNS